MSLCESLNEDVLFLILEWLDINSIFKLTKTCKYFHFEILHENGVFNLIIRKWEKNLRSSFEITGNFAYHVYREDEMFQSKYIRGSSIFHIPDLRFQYQGQMFLRLIIKSYLRQKKRLTKKTIQKFERQISFCLNK